MKAFSLACLFFISTSAYAAPKINNANVQSIHSSEITHAQEAGSSHLKFKQKAH